MNFELPKILWTLWFQGWDNAPAIVQKCKATWIEHNPDWTIHFLTTENLHEFIDLDAILPGYREKKMQPEALSNVIRMALLIKYGGVWADSTLYCNKPLDEWIHACVSPSGFFAYANPGPDRKLSTWFIAASPDHVILKKWISECVNYWHGRTERHTYHWCHYLFGELYEKDAVVREKWDQTPSVSADAPHYFLPYEDTLYAPLSRKVKRAIDKPEVPVFKLTFKYDPQKVKEDSVIQYLLSGKSISEDRKTIIIVGMHRSGTSLTTSLLQRSGLDIGDRLLEGGIGNKNGHFENVDFLNFHMNTLTKLNHHCDGWDEVEIETLDETFENEALHIVENNESALWGWKDPRTTLFIDFWARLLPEAHFLFVYRSPVEVVDSFYRRATDAVIMDDPEKALKVWMHYNTLILKKYEKLKDRALLLHIKSVIHDFPECVRKINEAFNVSLNANVQNVFDKELFNEKEETLIFRGKFLYDSRPDAHRLYKELIQASWHPAGMDYKRELALNENTRSFNEVFFKQWCDQYTHDAVQRKEHAAQLARLRQEFESEVRQVKTLIEEKDQIIFERQGEIEWMRKTKFWKLRIVWQKIKSSVGLN